jgi:hypothetical protein
VLLTATAVTTSVPGETSPVTSSVVVPSLMPSPTTTGVSDPFAYVQTLAVDAAPILVNGAIWWKAASVAVGGRNRSAAFGIRTTWLRLSTSTLIFAVIPGLSFKSGFGDSIIAL